MSQIEKNCKNCTNFQRIGIGTYAKIYKAQNKTTKSYVAIKEIDKKNIKFYQTKYLIKKK